MPSQFLAWLLALIAGLLAWSHSAQAQTTHTFTLEQCVDYALKNQPNLTKARLQVGVYKQDVREITSMGLPQVNGQLQAQDFLVIPTTIIPAGVFGPTETAVQFGTKYNITAGVSVQQLIFDGTYFLGMKAAREYVKLAQISEKRSQRDVKAAVQKAYYGVLVNSQRVKVLNEQARSLEQLLDDTRKLYENELAQKLDVNRLEVNFNNLNTEIAKVQALSELSLALLKFQMGMPYEDELVLTSALTDADFNPQADTSATLDIARRTEMVELKQGMYLTELNIKRYRMGYLPNLAAFGNFQYQNLSNEFAKPDNWFGIAVIGAQLNVPIFDGLRKDAQIQRTKIQRMQLEYDMRNLENSLNLEYAQSRVSYVNALRQLEIQQRNRGLAKEVYDNTMLRYKEGIGSNLEVVQAEAELNQSQTNYYNAMLEAYIARVDLQRALGQMD